MSDFNGAGAASGAMSGAQMGMAAGPWGALAGGVIGGAVGAFGGSKGPNYGALDDLISQRRSEIEAFSQRLESARNNVLTQYKNLQATTMARFAPALEASLAGRGLTVGSGAFASGIAHEAVGLQAGYDELNTNMTEKNLYDVDNLRAGLFAPQMQLGAMKAKSAYEARSAMMNAMGGALSKAMPAMAQGASSAGSSIFGGGGSGLAGMGNNGFSGNGMYSATSAASSNPFSSMSALAI